MEFVWITGPSAIGKFTLANRLTEPSSVELRKRLAISDAAQLLGYAEALEQWTTLDESKTGLVIWQARSDSVIEELAARGPSVIQRIILVWRPFDQHLAGYKEKRLRCYPQGFTVETPEEKWVAAVRHTRRVDADFVLKHSSIEITVVDASAGYRVLPGWPSDA